MDFSPLQNHQGKNVRAKKNPRLMNGCRTWISLRRKYKFVIHNKLDCWWGTTFFVWRSIYFAYCKIQSKMNRKSVSSQNADVCTSHTINHWNHFSEWFRSILLFSYFLLQSFSVFGHHFKTFDSFFPYFLF